MTYQKLVREMQNIFSLKDTYKGDIYVVGGGKSLDYYPPDFFNGRFVLAVNQASRIVPADYIVRKENTKRGDVPVIASKYGAGDYNAHENDADYIFDHNPNTLGTINDFDLHPNGDKIVVSWSTITSAIHIAAYMGARAVFLAGHDCASIDGDQVADGYYEDVNRFTAEQDYDAWLAVIAPQSVFMRDWLQKEYNVPLISLSPFIGLKHEGHEID